MHAGTTYTPAVHAIRHDVWRIFRDFCDYKAECLDPIDWRPREWNAGADYRVKYAVAARSSGGTLDAALVRQRFHEAIALQVFSDGVFVPGIGGAYGVQLMGYFGSEEKPQRVMIGYMYHFEEQARSAFDMEIAGIRSAVKIFRQSCESTL